MTNSQFQELSKATASAPQRVLFITDHLGGGGAPVSILSLAKVLTSRGMAVTILVLSDKVWQPIPEGVTVHLIPFSYRNVLEKIRRFRLHARKVDQWLNQSPFTFDLVVANLHYSHEVVCRTRLASQAWLCIRTDPAEALLNKRGILQLKQRRRLRALYQGRRVIAISKGILESLSRHDAQPEIGKVIYNVIDIETIHEKMTVPVEYDDYILFVGRLNLRAKRYDRLFRAYRDSGVAQPLLVIGDGEETEAKQLVHEMGLEDRIFLLGKKDNPYPYIHYARLLVLTSDYEGFGRVLAEALVCGTPVVSTDCPSGPRDILIGELSDYLVPPFDEEALSHCIANAVSHPPIISPQHYARFAPDIIADQYRELMSEDPKP
ncbi:MAG TPA: glycosyltransferase [Halomonas sp.]|nr:glycosyltransferase [Halomonas sp.]